MRNSFKSIIAIAMLSLALVGCGNGIEVVSEGQTNSPRYREDISTAAPVETTEDNSEIFYSTEEPSTKEENDDNQFSLIADETVALSESAPAIPVDFETSAPGVLVAQNGKAIIDYSNSSDGYVMVQYLQSTDRRLKVLVKGPTTQYQYNITAQQWIAMPLSDGSGQYTIGIYENVRDSSYSTVLSETIQVNLKDDFAPFLRSNQYVNIVGAPRTVLLAREICSGVSNPLEKVGRIYDWVITNISYDYAKANNVQTGYLPILDSILETKTGICFDYAALMTGMLRAEGIPCKLVIGYAGSAYHAWIDVYTEENGWVNGAVYFDGISWRRMDPTFASNGDSSVEIMQYIGDGQNYMAKYFY